MSSARTSRSILKFLSKAFRRIVAAEQSLAAAVRGNISADDAKRHMQSVSAAKIRARWNCRIIRANIIVAETGKSMTSGKVGGFLNG
jgi:Tfp pilus tip-associated adhesin PilY1